MLTGEADWPRLHDIARHDGPERALADVYARGEQRVIIAGPAGHALVPRDVAGSARSLWPSGVPVSDRFTTAATTAATTATAVTSVPIELSELVALRGLPVPGSDDDSYRGPKYRGWLLSLAWLRLGVCAGLYDAAISHVTSRTVAGAPLSSKQLIQGQLSDAVAEQLTARAILSGRALDGLPTAAIADAHQRISVAEGDLLCLLGAYGITAGAAGRAEHISALLADAYVGY